MDFVRRKLMFIVTIRTQRVNLFNNPLPADKVVSKFKCTINSSHVSCGNYLSEVSLGCRC